MKIDITQTELAAMPLAVLGKYWAFLLNSNVEYTPIQQTAAICYKYFTAVYNDGHQNLFETYEYISRAELTEALTDIGAKEFADNFIEASEYAVDSDYEKTDTWLVENEELITEALKKYLENNFDEFFQIVDEDYTMVPPQGLKKLGAIEVLVMVVLIIVFAIREPWDIWIIIPMFSIIALPGLAMIIYTSCWKCSIKKDVITIRRPFLKKSVIQIKEITKIRQTSEMLIIYANGRRFAAVNKVASNFSLFYAQLCVAEKIIKPDQLTDYAIRNNKTKFASAGLCLILPILFFNWDLTEMVKPLVLYQNIFFSVLALIALSYLICCIYWKMTVSGRNITIRRAFREKQEYDISDITKVNTDDQNIVLFAGEKKVAKIAIRDENCNALMHLLLQVEIPFYKNGQPV